MKASYITHHNELRIRIEFPYNQELVSKLKQIPDTRWSQSIKAWHVPRTKEVFEKLKELFPELEYSTSHPVLTKGKIKVLGEVSLVFIGYNLARCANIVDGLEKFKTLIYMYKNSINLRFSFKTTYFKFFSDFSFFQLRFSATKY